MSDALLYPISDALNISLYHHAGRKQMRGGITRNIAIGPWTLSFPLAVDTDVDDEKYTSVFLKIRKSLWGYIISGPNKQLFWLMFDGKSAGIKTGHSHEFMSGDLRLTLTRLKAHAKCLFQYDHLKDQWNDVDLTIIYPPAKIDSVDQ